MNILDDAWNDLPEKLKILNSVPGSIRRNDKNNQWGKNGTFPCPKCKTGNIHWYRYIGNGHLRVKCDTPDCFKAIS